MVKVSIVIPVYNGSEYIRRCFECAISQTLGEIEIIAVNDCSKDTRDVEIMEEYANKYPNQFITAYHNVNKCVGGARNTGISLAKGEYIAFCDQDDIVELNAMELMYDVARKENADIVTCGFDIMKNGIIRTKQTDCAVDNPFKFSHEVWHMLVKKSFLEGNELYFPENVSTDDLISYLWFLSTSKTVCIPEVLYHWIRRRDSESSGNGYRFCGSFARTFELLGAYKAYKTLSPKNKEIFKIAMARQLYYGIALAAGNESITSYQINDLCKKTKQVLNMFLVDFSANGFSSCFEAMVIRKTLKNIDILSRDNFYDSEYVLFKRAMEIFISTNKAKSICVWGAGIRGRRFAVYMDKLSIPFVIVDINNTLRGIQILKDIYVKSIDDVVDLGIVLVSAVGVTDDVIELLESKGINTVVMDFDDVLNGVIRR